MPLGDPIDTGNHRAVSVNGAAVIILLPPRYPMHAEEAIAFAAWLVASAEVASEESREATRARFLEVLEAVLRT